MSGTDAVLFETGVEIVNADVDIKMSSLSLYMIIQGGMH